MVTIDGKNFYEVYEVQKMFKIKDPRTIYRWIKNSKLRAKKVGKKWYIAEEAIKELIEEKNG